MVSVGIVGLSPAWDARYRPALQSLRTRIAVRAIYDPVFSRAGQAAAEFGAEAIDGMRVLARRPDIKALIVFDTGWSGTEALHLLCSASRPIFVGGALTADDAALQRLGKAAVSCGSMIMPELGQRYTPSTSRLRELIATRLGRPLQIEIDAPAPIVPRDGQPLGQRPWDEFLSRLADWCCYVIPTPPSEVSANSRNGHGGGSFRFAFAKPRSGGEPPTVEVRLSSESTDAAAEASSPRFRVRCERGEAELSSPSRIAWRTHHEDADESLSSDRSDVEVMLDHFCRRVVGGLIPVADLEDVRRSYRLARAALQSLETGSPVHLNGRA
jgi:predicted dehydrogenase